MRPEIIKMTSGKAYRLDGYGGYTLSAVGTSFTATLEVLVQENLESATSTLEWITIATLTDGKPVTRAVETPFVRVSVVSGTPIFHLQKLARMVTTTTQVSGITENRLNQRALNVLGLDKWYSALVTRQLAGQQINIVAALDSLTAGAGGSSYLDTFRDRVQRLLGDGGLGYVALHNTARAAESGLNFGVSGHQYLDNTTNTTTTPNVLYAANLFASSFAGAGYFDLSDSVRDFDTATVYYLKQPSGGSFKFGGSLNSTVIADKVTVATVAAAKSLGSTSYAKYGTFAGYNVSVGMDNNGPVQVNGVDFKRGTTGVRVHRLAQGGTTTQQIAALDNAAYIATLTGVGCDLFLLNAGMNDSGISRTAAQFTVDVRTILTRVVAANSSAAIVLIGPNETSVVVRNALLDEYRTQLKAVLAPEFNAAYFDVKDALGTYTEAQAKGLMFDTIHPSTAGNRVIAAALYQFLGDDAMKYGTGYTAQPGSAGPVVYTNTLATVYKTGATSVTPVVLYELALDSQYPQSSFTLEVFGGQNVYYRQRRYSLIVRTGNNSSGFADGVWLAGPFEEVVSYPTPPGEADKSAFTVSAAVVGNHVQITVAPSTVSITHNYTATLRYMTLFGNKVPILY